MSLLKTTTYLSMKQFCLETVRCFCVFYMHTCELLESTAGFVCGEEHVLLPSFDFPCSIWLFTL